MRRLTFFRTTICSLIAHGQKAIRERIPQANSRLVPLTRKAHSMFNVRCSMCSVEKIQIIERGLEETPVVCLPLRHEVGERAGVRWCSGLRGKDFYKACSISCRAVAQRRRIDVLGLVFAAAALLTPTTLLATPPAGYYLVWGDEFNGSSLDTTHWEYARNGWRNSAYDTSAAVSVSGGSLIITTYTQGGTNFTGFIDTANTANPIYAGYGYYETSMQFSNSPGQWSAFWLQTPWMMNAQPDGSLGNTNNDPTNGVEIDVFEHRCVDGNNVSWVNGGDNALHWNGYGSSAQSAVWSSQSLGVGAGFHTYGFLWKTNSYTFSVDGSTTWSTGQYMISSAQQFIRLTSEVQSNSWAGTVPSGGYPSLASSQVKMYVDYVRYYAPTNVHFWTGSSSAWWTNSGNWISNMIPAPGSDLTFSYFTRGNRTMTMGNDYSVDGLAFLTVNGTGAFTINSGNTLTLGAGGINMASANYNVTLNNALNLAADQTWSIAPNFTVNGTISGSATLTKTGRGTLILNGSNSFSGVLNVDTGGTNNDGVVLLANSAAASNLSVVSIRNTNLGVSALQLSNSVALPCGVNLAGRNSSVIPIEALSGTSNVITGGLTLTGGGSNYWLQADSGNFYIGGTVAAAGTATGNRTLTLQGIGNFFISAAIQNGSASAFNLLKTNSGNLTLSGANTYTGGTTNYRGTLFVNGSLSGPLTINSGYLSGTGAVAGVTTVKSGCVLSPGTAIANSIGTLSFGSSLTLSAGSTMLMEINAASQTNDVVNVAGTLNCGGTLYISTMIGTGAPAPGQSFHLFNAGTIAGNFSVLTLPSLAAGLAWNTNNLAGGFISVIAVSPPETLGMTNLGNGQLQLNWDYGMLQCSTNVAGPYDTLSNLTSPYIVPTTNAQMFYRIQEQ